nr:S24 family peptidase [Mycobacterium sp.]
MADQPALQRRLGTFDAVVIGLGSMIGAGIFDGDFVVVRRQVTADNGDIVVAGIPGEEATVKTFKSKGSVVTLVPANPRLTDMVFDASDVAVYGKVVTVL